MVTLVYIGCLLRIWACFDNKLNNSKFTLSYYCFVRWLDLEKYIHKSNTRLLV